METEEQATREDLKNDEEPWVEENSKTENPEEELLEEEPAKDTTANTTQEEEPESNEKTTTSQRNIGGDRNVFVNGLAVGLGIGCIATFIIMWIAVFFSPQLPAGATYESMLSMFVFPLVYLLAVGLIALTAGIVREYYIPRAKT
jgi:hypothetical protein